MKKNNNTRVLVIIQARMASSRLPEKVIMKLDGIPLIQHTIERAKKAINVDKVILATSKDKSNDSIEKLCRNLGVIYFRGQENDVLSRFIKAAEEFHPGIVVRICGDEPLLDSKILEKAIEMHKNMGVDYSTTVGSVPKGLDVEVINYDALKKADENAKTEEQREHVTKYILDNPKDFKIQKLNFGKHLARPDIAITVDTKEDFEFVEKIYYLLKKSNSLYSGSLSEKIIEIVDNNEAERKPIILLRADGSKEKGIGDIISLINMSDYLKDNFEFRFALRDYEGGIGFVKKKGYDVLCIPVESSKEEEVKQIESYCRLNKIKYCIIEIVPNDAVYVKELSKFLKVMVVDFEGSIKVYSDVLLSWNISAADLKYNYINKNALKLLGPEYTPLGNNILNFQKKVQNKGIKNITIVFGGTDAFNLSFILLDAISKIENKYNFTFILGPGFANSDSFKEKAQKIKCKIIISPKNIHEIFSESDLVISGGGLTAFELAGLGVPFIGISKVPWEIKRLKKMNSLGICRFVAVDKNMGMNVISIIEELLSQEKRIKMVGNGKRLVDGKGCLRIAEAIKSRWKNGN
jgi:spore coat polysaccharide biosynthesis protein SpsF